MDLLVVSRAIVLNGLLGIGLARFLEIQVWKVPCWVDFSADIVLHVLIPLIAPLLV